MSHSLDPCSLLPPVPTFELRSAEITGRESLGVARSGAVFGGPGRDRSPRLAWSGHPAGTPSFAVTCFDPDALTVGGFRHRVVHDIPASVNELSAGAGDVGAKSLPAPAKVPVNDCRSAWPPRRSTPARRRPSPLHVRSPRAGRPHARRHCGGDSCPAGLPARRPRLGAGHSYARVRIPGLSRDMPRDVHRPALHASAFRLDGTGGVSAVAQPYRGDRTGSGHMLEVSWAPPRGGRGRGGGVRWRKSFSS